MCKGKILLREFAKLLSSYAAGSAQVAGDGQEQKEEEGMKKWLHPQDFYAMEEVLTKQTAARIVHDFVKFELHEKDEEDWESAKNLKDFYDCRTCVNHVAQVFVKGIMVGITDDCFGMREPLSKEEAYEVAVRIFDVRKRRQSECGKTDEKAGENDRKQGEKVGENDREQDEKAGENRKKEEKTTKKQEIAEKERSQRAPVYIKPEELPQFLLKHSKMCVLDVRTNEEFLEKHMEGALHVPMTKLLRMANGSGENKEMAEIKENLSDRQGILCYCEQGYQSKIAAKCLLEMGFLDACYTAIVFEKESE